MLKTARFYRYMSHSVYGRARLCHLWIPRLSIISCCHRLGCMWSRLIWMSRAKSLKTIRTRYRCCTRWARATIWNLTCRITYCLSAQGMIAFSRYKVNTRVKEARTGSRIFIRSRYAQWISGSCFWCSRFLGVRLLWMFLNLLVCKAIQRYFLNRFWSWIEEIWCQSSLSTVIQ